MNTCDPCDRLGHCARDGACLDAVDHRSAPSPVMSAFNALVAIAKGEGRRAKGEGRRAKATHKL